MEERGTGVTTRQILWCPDDSIYVCPNNEHVRYCKEIAVKNGRHNIRFTPLGSWTSHARGTRRPVVVDHYVLESISSEDWKEICFHNSIVEAYRVPPE
jgi:hypothetical protein